VGPLPVFLPTPRAAARGSELIGSAVVDFDGQPLGTVADLVFPESSDTIALVRRADGTLACVPMSRLLAHLRKTASEADAKPAVTAQVAPTASVQTFIFSENPGLLASAEPVASAAEVDAAAVQRARKHFLVNEPVARQDDGAGDERKPLALADLLGGTVNDERGRRVGDVLDVAVNLNRSRASYLIISTSGRSGPSGKLHGAPLDLLSPGDDSSLVLSLTAETVRSALHGIDLERLPLQADLPHAPRGAQESPRS
jgi:sporulation protein YlmC with PRC-barrel domain